MGCRIAPDAHALTPAGVGSTQSFSHRGGIYPILNFIGDFRSEYYMQLFDMIIIAEWIGGS